MLSIGLLFILLLSMQMAALEGDSLAAQAAVHADDECRAQADVDGDGGACSLSALQLRGVAQKAGQNLAASTGSFGSTAGSTNWVPTYDGDVGGAVGKAVKGAVGGAVNRAAGVAGALRHSAGDIFDGAIDASGTVGKAAANAGESFGKTAGGALGNAIKGAVGALDGASGHYGQSWSMAQENAQLESGMTGAQVDEHKLDGATGIFSDTSGSTAFGDGSAGGGAVGGGAVGGSAVGGGSVSGGSFGGGSVSGGSFGGGWAGGGWGAGAMAGASGWSWGTGWGPAAGAGGYSYHWSSGGASWAQEQADDGINMSYPEIDPATGLPQSEDPTEFELLDGATADGASLVEVDPRSVCGRYRIKIGTQGCCGGTTPYSYSKVGCCGNAALYWTGIQGCCLHQHSVGVQIYDTRKQNCCDSPPGVCTIKSGTYTCCGSHGGRRRRHR